MELEFERYFSRKRLESFGGIDQHKQNLLLMQKISPKLQLIEISIRNICDKIIRNRGYEIWLEPKTFEKICREYQIDKSSIDVLIKMIETAKGNDQDHLISRLNFGFWSAIIEKGIINSTQILIHHKEFIDFSKYAQKNRIDIIRRLPVQIRLNATIMLAKNIRNRAFHCENLLKFNMNRSSRLTYKTHHNGIIVFTSVEPFKLELFLSDLLKSIDKEAFKEFLSP